MTGSEVNDAHFSSTKSCTHTPLHAKVAVNIQSTSVCC